MAVGILGHLGFRVNFAQAAGIQVKAGPGMAVFGADSLDGQREMGLEEDELVGARPAWILGAAVNPYFGPFGRFYFGPEVWVAHWEVETEHLSATRRTVSRNGTVTTVTNETIIPEHASGLTYGGGMLFGGLVGSREQVNIWGSVRVGSRKEHWLGAAPDFPFITERKPWVSLVAGVDFDLLPRPRQLDPARAPGQ